MFQQFNNHIISNKLIKSNTKILLTVSGGADSVVMLDLFSKTKYDFAIAHCNFQLRGTESNEEELFVSKLAKKYKVPFFVKKFDTKKHIKEHGSNVQEAARELRYQWFNEILKDNGFDCIATAHHADDSLETFFINLNRGAGINGLKGIPLKNGNIIRPLLFASKQDILKYTTEHKLKFCSDSSNLKDDYLRNNIRINVLPGIEKKLKGFSASALKSIQHINNENSLLENLIAQFCKGHKVIEIKNNETILHLNKIPFSLNSFLFHLIKEYGINESQLQNILEAYSKSVSGKIFETENFLLLLNRTELIVQPKPTLKNPDKEYIINSLNDIPAQLPLNLSFGLLKKTDNITKKLIDGFEQFDLSVIKFPLILRKWKKGDRLKPLGMKGFKKVSDLLTEKKLSIFEKQNIWILSSNQRIFWLIGIRIDNDFAVTEKTKQILTISYCF